MLQHWARETGMKLGWVGVVRSFDCRGPWLPTLNSHHFQPGFSFIFYYKSSQGRGTKWGTGHRILNSKGTVYLQTLSGYHLSSTLPRTAVPYPWTQGKHLPGST